VTVQFRGKQYFTLSALAVPATEAARVFPAARYDCVFLRATAPGESVIRRGN
jgi:hypothetical protein